MDKEKKRKHSLSRRDFLKGAGAATVGAAALGLFGSTVFASDEEPDAVTEATEEEEQGGRQGGGSREASGEVTPGEVTSGERVWGYSGPGDWLGKAPEIAESDIAKTLECDVAVIGLGHGGVQAVLGAAEKGAKVIGVEKHPKETHTWFGEDFGAWNSKVQVEQAGFGPYDLGEVVDEFVTRGGGRVFPDIVRLYVNNSGPTMDRMLEVAKEMGVDPRVYTYDPTPDGWLIIQANFDYDKWASGADIYDCLRKEYPIHTGTKTWAASCQFMGEYNDHQVAGVAANSKLPLVNQACLDKCVRDYGTELMYGTSGVVLVQDEETKAVTGVIVQDDATGEYIRINTKKGVVMAGGDYAGNKEMSWALLNEYMERSERSGGSVDRFYSSGRDGSSVKMMCWAGGYVEPAPRGTMVLGGGPGGPWGTNAMLWLNGEGKRFCNEGNITGAQTACARQKRGTSCCVVDKNWMRTLCACGLEHGGPNAGRPQFYQDLIDGMAAIEPGTRGSVIGCTVAERMNANVLCASTLEELADMIGYRDEAKANFLASIERYNELCRAGVDSDFGKQPSVMFPIEEGPFYACTGSVGNGGASVSMVTMSGVMTDNRLNVVDLNGNPIKGLYTCGNSLGGRYGTGYNTPCAGNSIGMAGTHGRLAGQFVCEDN